MADIFSEGIHPMRRIKDKNGEERRESNLWDNCIEHSKRSSVQNELSVPVRDEFGKRNVVRRFQRHTPMDHTRRGRYRNLDSTERPKKKRELSKFFEW